MCIFSGIIEHVSNTKILVSVIYPSELKYKNINGLEKGVKMPKYERPFQLTVYSNKTAFDTAIKPTMILPFPLKRGGNQVKLLNFCNYARIFEDLDLLFPIDEIEMNATFSNNFDDEEIAVEYIGDYKASIVPNFDAIAHVSKKEFSIAQETVDLLGKYYKTGYGFIVCELTVHNKQYSPFAYMHEIRDDRKLFVPTRHFHSHSEPNITYKYDSGLLENDESYDLDDFYARTLNTKDKYLEIYEKRLFKQPATKIDPVDWDHEIYIINFPRIMHNPLYQNKAGLKVIEADSARIKNVFTYLNSSSMPSEIAFGKIKFAYKIVVTPIYKYNHDFLI
jgi:hypothetical protein